MTTPTIRKPKPDASPWAWPEDLPDDLARLSGLMLLEAAAAHVMGDAETLGKIRHTIAQGQRESAMATAVAQAQDALEDAVAALQAARDDVAQPDDLRAGLKAAEAVLKAEERLALVSRLHGYDGRAVGWTPPENGGAMARPGSVHHASHYWRDRYTPNPTLAGSLLAERLLAEAEAARYLGKPAVLPAGLETKHLDRAAVRVANLRKSLAVVLARVQDPLATPKMRSHEAAHRAWLEQVGRALTTGLEPEEGWVEIPSPFTSVAAPGGFQTMPNAPAPGVS